MFVSFIMNVIFMIIKLIKFPTALKGLANRCEHLTQKETFTLHQKEFTGGFFKLLLINALFLSVGILTCLFDGLSDTENGLLIPVWTFLAVAFAGIVFLVAYSSVLKRKYNIVESCTQDPVWNKGYCAAAQTGLCVFLAFTFAFNCALTAYTLGLLLI